MSEERDTVVRYQRRGELVRLTLTNVTNHELREVLVGLWARLPPADRDDHMKELAHYRPMLANPARFPARHLSPVAKAIAEGPAGESTVDLLTKGPG